MGVKLTYLAPLLAAGAAAVMISAAPIASADSTTQQSCNETVSGSVRESPGNVEPTTPLGRWISNHMAKTAGHRRFFGGFGDHGGGFRWRWRRSPIAIRSPAPAPQRYVNRYAQRRSDGKLESCT